jgi:hypothetical protein
MTSPRGLEKMQVSPLRCASVEITSPRGLEKMQVSPLRCAPVEMTSFRRGNFRSLCSALCALVEITRFGRVRERWGRKVWAVEVRLRVSGFFPVTAIGVRMTGV